EVTAEVRVNDERVQLTFSNTASPAVYKTPMDAVGNPLYSYSGEVLLGIKASVIDASTIEVSIAEGSDKGKLLYFRKGYTYYNEPVYEYKFFVADSNQPYYDTNETIHINYKCPENLNASGSVEIYVYRPQISDTLEVIDNYNNCKWVYKKLGYRNASGAWFNSINYKGHDFYHGDYLGFWFSNSATKLNQKFYCGEPFGIGELYINGTLSERNTYENFTFHKLERWQYTTEDRINPATGYYQRYQITKKITSIENRTNIYASWVNSTYLQTQYDGWSAE
ncbi:MAG: hypothetical protein GYA62_01095, partial [Bacteroidales bacterium]|nr:hypothetical protein [Bacteroidales bacterium]